MTGRISARGVFATLFAVAVAVLCIRLGFWQLNRLEQRRIANAQLTEAVGLPAFELRDSASAIASAPARFLNRRVLVRGRYDPAGQVVLRGRVSDGRPGVHLVTPLYFSSDSAILINRGWVAASDGSTPSNPPAPPPGEHDIEALILEAPDALGGTPSTSSGQITFSRLPLDSLSALPGSALLPFYAQEIAGDADGPPDPARMPRIVPIAAPDQGPHLGYAIQWFSFAAIAIVGISFLILRRPARAS